MTSCRILRTLPIAGVRKKGGVTIKFVKRSSYWFLAVSLSVSSQVIASSWDFNYKNLTQMREGRSSNREAPVNQYVSIELSDMPRNFSFQTDVRSYVDAAASDDRAFDLYQAAFHVEPVEHFSIDGGRMWFTDGFDATLMDGGKFSLFPSDGYVGGSVYAGVPRYIEMGDFTNQMEGLIVGTNLNLQGVKDATAQFSARWKKIDATTDNYKENDTIYLGLAASYQFSDIKTTPNVYGDFEYDLAGETINNLNQNLPKSTNSKAATLM